MGWDRRLGARWSALLLFSLIISCGTPSSPQEGRSPPSPTSTLSARERIAEYLANHSLAPVATAEPRTPSPTAAPTLRPTPSPISTVTRTPVPNRPQQAPTSGPSLCGAPANPFRYTLCPGDIAKNAVLSPPYPTFCEYFDCVGGFWTQTGWVHRCALSNAAGVYVYGHSVLAGLNPDLGRTPVSYWSGSCHFFGGDGPGLFYSP